MNGIPCAAMTDKTELENYIIFSVLNYQFEESAPMPYSELCSYLDGTHFDFRLRFADAVCELIRTGHLIASGPGVEIEDAEFYLSATREAVA